MNQRRKRTHDSGRKDSLGRRIMVSLGMGQHVSERTTQQAMEDMQRLSNEFSYASSQAAQAFVHGDMRTFGQMRQEAAKIYAVYQGWSDEVEKMTARQSTRSYEKFRKNKGLDNPHVPVARNIHNRYSANAQQLHEADNAIRGTEHEYRTYLAQQWDREQARKKQEQDNYARFKAGEQVHNASYDDNEVIDAEIVDDVPETESQGGGETYSSHDASSHGDRDYRPVPRPQYHADKYAHSSQQHSHKGTQENSYHEPIDAEARVKHNYNSDSQRRKAYTDSSGFASFSHKDYHRKLHQDKAARKQEMSCGGIPRGSGHGSSGKGFFGAMEKATGLDKVGQFRVTWRPRLGPFIFNMGRGGLTSVSLGMGNMRYRLWGRDTMAGFSSLDLPSGLSFRGKTKRK